jgi:chitinase
MQCCWLPHSSGHSVNSHGQVDGVSLTSATVNPGTGKPTEHPFIWSMDKGMRDLGTLGGTVAFPTSEEGITLNNRGEVVGQSYLEGDVVFHPFLWNGSKMIDLGTFGGTYGAANAINQAGDVVGFAQVTAGGTCRAFLWKKGKKINLGVVPGPHSSSAFSVNAHDDVVGGVCYGGGGGPVAWLWHNGKMHDLQKLVAPSRLHLTAAYYIADNGRIVATATLPNGHQRVVLLTPAGSQ